MAKKVKEPHDPYTPQSIMSAVGCDTDRLYGTIDQAIAYLQEIKAAHPDQNPELHEEWTGYEDMHMEFSLETMETQAEANNRADAEIKTLHLKTVRQAQVDRQRADLKRENAAHKRRVNAINSRGAN